MQNGGFGLKKTFFIINTYHPKAHLQKNLNEKKEVTLRKAPIPYDFLLLTH